MLYNKLSPRKKKQNRKVGKFLIKGPSREKRFVESSSEF